MFYRFIFPDMKKPPESGSGRLLEAIGVTTDKGWGQNYFRKSYCDSYSL